ncbi:MAG: SdpI family protein [Oscillospiraceae bacterium]|nr:SdpI family protein [Oscillospiraceae bacterium]
MILKNKKLLIITSLLILLPIPIGLLLWNRFPEAMTIHWGFNGQPDGFASIPVAVFVPPLCMLLVHWFCIVVTSLDKGNRNRNQKIQSIVLWTIPIVCNLSCCGIYALSLGVEFSPVLWTMVPMGILFILIGNYMPKTKMNYTIGIKVAWAYTSEENWAATHRFGGKVWVIGGVLMALSGFLPNGWAVTVMITVALLATIIPIVYSWRFYKMEQAAGKDVKVSYSKIDKTILKWTAVFLAITTLFILAILFTGDLEFTLLENRFSIKADWYSDITIRYDAIEAIEYREQNVPGLRVGGFGSFRLLMGFFENEEFGTYTRYTYYDPEACIVATVRGKAVVLSGKTAAETRTLYDSLLEKIS